MQFALSDTKFERLAIWLPSRSSAGLHLASATVNTRNTVPQTAPLGHVLRREAVPRLCGVPVFTRPVIGCPINFADCVIGSPISSQSAGWQARRKAAGRSLTNISFHHGDAEKVELEAGSFDVITCSSAMIYLEDVPRALKRLCTWLRPGGRLVFNTPQVRDAKYCRGFCICMSDMLVFRTLLDDDIEA